jgi:hypothetical protein
MWTRFQGATTPARCFAAMAYDETRKTLVMFGGYQQNGNQGDTWEFTGNKWRKVADL